MKTVSVILALLLPVVPVAWQAGHYIDQKKQELRDRRFTTFYDLIRRLVEPELPDGAIYLDRQVAIVFELRNFPG